MWGFWPSLCPLLLSSTLPSSISHFPRLPLFVFHFCLITPLIGFVSHKYSCMLAYPLSIRGYTLKENWSPLQKPSAVYSSSVRDGAHGPCPFMLEYWLTTGVVQRATVAMHSWVQRSYHVEDIVSLWSPLTLPTSASFIFLLPLPGWSLGLAEGLRVPSMCSICGWVLHGIPPHFGQLENLGQPLFTAQRNFSDK